MAKFRMARIDPPEWALYPELRISGVLVVEYAAIRRRRKKMLGVVQRELEAYLNDPRLVFDGAEEGFPHRQRLAGTYYIGGESYTAHRDPDWYQIGIKCRCLELPRLGMDQGDDYLGLDVWLKCVPGKWSTFEAFRSVDSSAI